MEFIKLTKTAILPVRGTKFSAGYDFYTDEDVTIFPNEVVVIKTGISFENMPDDQYLQLSLRSGTSIKVPILMANGYGVIDSDYAGKEIGIIVVNRHPIIRVTIDKGTKLAQGILLKYYTVEGEIKPTKVRTGGKGSTGN